MGIIKKFRIKSFKNIKPLIKLEKISLSFGKRQVLDDINFTVNQGEIFTIIGPNGAGKSTLFNVISRIYEPSNGEIHFNDQNISKRKRIFKSL